MLNELKENLSYSRVFFPSILILTVVIDIVTLLFLETSTKTMIILLSSSIFLFFIVLNIIGKKRKTEINLIKTIIKAIRENEYSNQEEIKLGNNLIDLEEEIKAMVKKTQNDIANLKKLEQVRTEFLGNVSHELRTPIFAMQGYLETLLDGALDDKKVNRSFLQKANQHTINLSNLLNDLIDISMIESGQMKMSLRYFNISEFLHGLLTEMQPHANKKGIELRTSTIPNDLQLFGDKERLRQVMNNLIMNAIKYTENGYVEIGVIEDKNKANIYIKDTGIGIASDDLARIFERFYRVDKDRSREMGGTGLGLAIVKHILEAHGSKIEVESEIGKGTEFSFPLKK